MSTKCIFFPQYIQHDSIKKIIRSGTWTNYDAKQFGHTLILIIISLLFSSEIIEFSHMKEKKLIKKLMVIKRLLKIVFSIMPIAPPYNPIHNLFLFHYHSMISNHVKMLAAMQCKLNSVMMNARGDYKFHDD